MRATNIAHSTQKQGDIETNNTTAPPQQGTTETGITSAPENCTRIAHFSPSKATRVSHHRDAWPTGPDCGTRGRRRHHRQPNLACNSIGRSFNNI